MYERMLDKQNAPTKDDMAVYCGDSGGLFTSLNQWLSESYGTVQEIVFPYGNKYGWGIAHKKNRKLICNIFAENNAFTVMVRLSDNQFDSVCGRVMEYSRKYIDERYPCGGGGWIHYRVTCGEHFDDIKKMLSEKIGYTATSKIQSQNP